MPQGAPDSDRFSIRLKHTETGLSRLTRFSTFVLCPIHCALCTAAAVALFTVARAINRARRSAVIWRGHRRHLLGRHQRQQGGGAPSVLPDLSSTDCCCILLHSTLPTCALSCAPTLYRPVIVSWRGTLNEPLRLPFNLE